MTPWYCVACKRRGKEEEDGPFHLHACTGHAMEALTPYERSLFAIEHNHSIRKFQK
jgi:hypothetical protein